MILLSFFLLLLDVSQNLAQHLNVSVLEGYNRSFPGHTVGRPTRRTAEGMDPLGCKEAFSESCLPEWGNREEKCMDVFAFFPVRWWYWSWSVFAETQEKIFQQFRFFFLGAKNASSSVLRCSDLKSLSLGILIPQLLSSRTLDYFCLWLRPALEENNYNLAY